MKTKEAESGGHGRQGTGKIQTGQVLQAISKEHETRGQQRQPGRDRRNSNRTEHKLQNKIQLLNTLPHKTMDSTCNQHISSGICQPLTCGKDMPNTWDSC